MLVSSCCLCSQSVNHCQANLSCLKLHLLGQSVRRHVTKISIIGTRWHKIVAYHSCVVCRPTSCGLPLEPVPAEDSEDTKAHGDLP